MPLFLISSVCDEGLFESSFKVVEADSRVAIAEDILRRPYEWKSFLARTKLWWELTYYEYKYGQPRGWSPDDLLRHIDATHVDGDSDYQFRIFEVGTIEQIPPLVLPLVVDPKGEPAQGKGWSGLLRARQ